MSRGPRPSPVQTSERKGSEQRNPNAADALMFSYFVLTWPLRFRGLNWDTLDVDQIRRAFGFGFGATIINSYFYLNFHFCCFVLKEISNAWSYCDNPHAVHPQPWNKENGWSAGFWPTSKHCYPRLLLLSSSDLSSLVWNYDSHWFKIMSATSTSDDRNISGFDAIQMQRIMIRSDFVVVDEMCWSSPVPQPWSSVWHDAHTSRDITSMAWFYSHCVKCHFISFIFSSHMHRVGGAEHHPLLIVYWNWYTYILFICLFPIGENKISKHIQAVRSRL